MRVYRVKLIEGHLAQPEQIVEGYLGNSFNDGKIQLYSIGQAKKKAAIFGGKVEAFGKNFTVAKVSMLQLAASELSDGVRNLLNQRIRYNAENPESYDKIHFGCVFNDILEQKGEWVKGFDFDEEVSDIVEELSILDILSTNYDYVQILVD